MRPSPARWFSFNPNDPRRLAGFAVLAIALSSSASAIEDAIDRCHYEISVIAETFSSEVDGLLPDDGKPIGYIGVDGGVIEAGQPLREDLPAASLAVATAMQRALAARGFRTASPELPPRVLIVYHWGVVCADISPHSEASRLGNADRMRLELVARRADARRIELELVASGMSPPALRVPSRLMRTADRATVLLANNDHCFVAISAYDYAALNGRKLLWRVKLTTKIKPFAMPDALMALVHYGRRYFACNEPGRIEFRGAPTPGEIAPLWPIETFPVPTDATAALVRAILDVERALFSGAPSDDDGRDSTPVQS